MKRICQLSAVLAVLFIAGSASSLLAQAGEVYLFGGGVWSGSKVGNLNTGNPFVNTSVINPGDVKIPGGGTFGGKAGGFIGDNFELDGNLSWYNHFNLEAAPGVFYEGRARTRAWLWEGSTTWNFGEAVVGDTRLTPYVTIGAGGITARTKDGVDTFVSGGGVVFNTVQNNFEPNPGRQIVMNQNDTFFTFSYGGGFKAIKLFGPGGVRFDLRGRTIPNFYSRSITRPELTGGLIFTWGE